MRLEYLNGSIVPYDLSFDELVNMLHSSTMKDFCLACEALSEIKSQEAYKVLKQYLYDKDPYLGGALKGGLYMGTDGKTLCYADSIVAANGYTGNITLSGITFSFAGGILTSAWYSG